MNNSVLFFCFVVCLLNIFEVWNKGIVEFVVNVVINFFFKLKNFNCLLIVLNIFLDYDYNRFVIIIVVLVENIEESVYWVC